MALWQGGYKTGSSIGGVDVYIYPPNNEQRSVEELKDYVRKFKLNSALMVIGNLARLYSSEHPATKQIQVPMSDWFLAKAVQYFIENSNDYRAREPVVNDIVQAVHLLHCIPKGDLGSHSSDLALLRYGSSIFEIHQPAMGPDFARTYLIYEKLWPTVDNASRFAIHDAFRETFGLSLMQLLVFGLLHHAQDNSFISIQEGFPEEGSFAALVGLNEDSQRTFLNRFSYSYDEFRRQSLQEKAKAPTADLAHYALNPLFIRPIVRSDQAHDLANGTQYIVPVPRLIVEKITKGLYYDLSESFKQDGKRNDFKTAFGKVFEAYVAYLLENCLKDAVVKREREYDKSHGVKHTPDCVVLRGKTLVSFEMKVAGTYLQSKTFADPADIKRDIARTLAKGIKQIYEFEQSIEKFSELQEFQGCEQFERVIVTFDSLYFASSIIRDHSIHAAQDLCSEIPRDYSCHIMTIDELESVVAIPSLDLFDFLRAKTEERNVTDFGNYLRAKKQVHPNEFLNAIFKDYPTLNSI